MGPVAELLKIEPKDPSQRPAMERDIRILFRMLYGELGLSKFQLEHAIETILGSVNEPHALLQVFDAPQTRHFGDFLPGRGNDPFLHNFGWTYHELVRHPTLEVQDSDSLSSEQEDQTPIKAVSEALSLALEKPRESEFARDELAARLDEIERIEADIENFDWTREGTETRDGYNLLDLLELKRQHTQEIQRLERERRLPQHVSGLPRQRRMLQRANQGNLGQSRWEQRKLDLEEKGSWIEPSYGKNIPWDVPEEKLTADALRYQVRRIDAWLHFRTNKRTPSLAVVALIGAALDLDKPVPLAEGLDTWMRLVTEIRRIDEETHELASGWIGDMIFVKGLVELLPAIDRTSKTSNFIVAASYGGKIKQLALATFIVVAAQLTKRHNIRFEGETETTRRLRDSDENVLFLADDQVQPVSCRFNRGDPAEIWNAVGQLKDEYQGQIQHASTVWGEFNLSGLRWSIRRYEASQEDQKRLSAVLGVKLNSAYPMIARRDSNWDRYVLALKVMRGVPNAILIVDTAFNIATLPAAGPREWFLELMKLDRVWYCEWHNTLWKLVTEFWEVDTYWDDDYSDLFSAPLQVKEPEHMLLRLQIPEDADFPEKQRGVDRDFVADAQAEQTRWLEEHGQRLENFPWGQEERWDELNPSRRRQDEERAWHEPVLHPQGFYDFFPEQSLQKETEGPEQSDFYTLLAQHQRSKH